MGEGPFPWLHKALHPSFLNTINHFLPHPFSSGLISLESSETMRHSGATSPFMTISPALATRKTSHSSCCSDDSCHLLTFFFLFIYRLMSPKAFF